MQYTPKQLKKIIEDRRAYWLRAYHTLETYEAILESGNDPILKEMPSVQKIMNQDLNHIRKKLKIAAGESRKNLNAIEEFLVEDEAANGWMVEYRIIDLNAI